MWKMGTRESILLLEHSPPLPLLPSPPLERLLDSFQILSAARVHADQFAFVDEKRNGHDGAGFKRGGFGAALGCVAAKTRDRFGRRGTPLFAAARRPRYCVFPGRDLDGRVVAQKLGDIADLLLRQLKLLESRSCP